MAPYVDFDRSSWARLRAATPLTLGERDLAELHQKGTLTEEEFATKKTELLARL